MKTQAVSPQRASFSPPSQDLPTLQGGLDRLDSLIAHTSELLCKARTHGDVLDGCIPENPENVKHKDPSFTIDRLHMQLSRLSDYLTSIDSHLTRAHRRIG